MALESIKRMLRERKMREDEAFAEREHRRLAEVKAAFFEGMAAGYDRSWMERPPGDYWLESDARRTLYAGPPVPIEHPERAALFRQLGRHRRGYSYDPQRDPGRVIGKSFDPARKKRKRP